MNNQKLNWIRAGILGANDGIISVATALIALLGVIKPQTLTLVALATITAGTISMSAGEWVSVSTQRDAEKTQNLPNSQLTNPIHAAIASAGAFLVGALIPAALAILTQNAIWTIVGVIIALTITGIVSSPSKSTISKNIGRNLVAGATALTVSIIINITLNNITT